MLSIKLSKKNTKFVAPLVKKSGLWSSVKWPRLFSMLAKSGRGQKKWANGHFCEEKWAEKNYNIL